jgi:hypothetical protein
VSEFFKSPQTTTTTNEDEKLPIEQEPQNQLKNGPEKNVENSPSKDPYQEPENTKQPEATENTEAK